MKSRLFGNGKELQIADLKVGDEIAEIAGGVLVKMYVVKKKTPLCLWLTNALRVNFQGDSLKGDRKFRVPTTADKTIHITQLRRVNRAKVEREILTREEYKLAKKIGAAMLNGFGKNSVQYLTFLTRIGLERLRAFHDSIQESK